MGESIAHTLHQPVLLAQCLSLLVPVLQTPGSIYVDCTLGMGGHTQAVLDACPLAIAIGIDRDPQAIALASERIAQYGDRFIPVHATYDQVDQVVAQYTSGKGANAILLDLGVSSLQLDKADRGFAYALNAPLDMRMDQTANIPTAADILANLSQSQITHILYTYGEEKQAKRIAKAVVAQRDKLPIRTTGQLVQIIRETIPQAVMRTGGHPAKRTFQALRIAVNQELEILERTLPAALSALQLGGRLVIESYHSLEDRLVKQVFRSAASVQAPPDMPVVPAELQPSLRLLTRGAIQADSAEQEKNPRSKSVRLRAVELIRPYKFFSAKSAIEQEQK